MPAVVREFFRIILEEDNYIAFGERNLGAIGKDILAVKTALGLVTSPTTIQSANEDNSIGESDGWFDCRTGKVISAREGATFDVGMEVALMKFQLDNQYLILSYLFNKYGVRNFLQTTEQGMDFFDAIGNPQDGAAATGEEEAWYGERRNQVIIPGRAALENLLKEITAIEALFQDEFGRLGEATLAVLHGWLPYTKFKNISYNVEEPPEQLSSYPYPLGFRAIIEASPIQLYTMLAERIIKPDWGPDHRDSSIIQMASESEMSEAEDQQFIHDWFGWFYDDPGTNHEDPEGLVRLDGTMGILDLYSATPTGHQTFLREAKKYDSIDYGVILWRPHFAAYESPLYVGCKDVIENIELDENNSDLLSPEQRADLVERAFYPSPYIDPDPFIINTEKIGFFARTNFTFQNLPDFTEETINILEDAALTRVLEFYEKPEIWFMDKDSPPSVLNYFSIEEAESRPMPAHSGLFSTGQDWVLTTREIMTSERVPEGSTQHYSVISDLNENMPLIQFIEYQEPTLRPGDVYRAFFEISRKKLDYIRRGTDIPEPAAAPGSPATFPWEDEQNRLESLEQDLSEFGCVPSSMTDEEARAQYEKYRAHAAKNKKALVRELRAKTQEHYEKASRPKAFSADLGPFGQVNINDDSWSAFGGLEAIGSIRDSFGLRDMNPDKAMGSGRLKVSMPIFELQCEKAAEAIKKAGSRLDGIEFTKAYDSGQESAHVANMPSLIKNQIVRSGTRKGQKVSKILSDSAKGSMNPNLDLIFVFSAKKNAKQKRIGSQLDILRIGDDVIWHRGDNDALGAKKKKFPAHYDKHRTMHYLNNIVDITGINPADSGAGGFFKDMFNPKGSTCSDELAAAFGEGGGAFIMKYTLDLDIKPSKKKKLNPFHAWAKEEIQDPYKKWAKESKKNWEKTKKKNKNQSTVWGKDELLPLIGEACTLDEIYAEFIDRYNIFSLMCAYLKCLRLPAMNIKAPNFHLPPIPELPVFGFPGISDLVKNFTTMILEVLQRALCSIVKMMMDLLSSTTCDEELKEAMYGAGSPELSKSPIAEQAFVDAMLDFGVDRNNPEALREAQEFVDDSSRFLTPNELCRLFQGEPISAQARAMLLRLAETKPELAEYLNDSDKIVYFFEGIGIFIDPDLCERLGEYDQVLGAFSCRDTYELLNQQRSRMMSGGQVANEEIEEALERSRRNLMNKAKAMEIMSAEDGGPIAALLPPLSGPEFGNDFPPAMMDLANRVLRSVFESPKSSYVSSLKKWKPSLYLDIPAAPDPGDPGYDSELVMRVEQAVENLRRYSEYVENELDSKLSPRKPLSKIVTALYLLFEEYAKNGKDAITQEVVEGLYPRRTRTIVIEPKKDSTMHLREPVLIDGQVPVALQVQDPRKFDTISIWPINLVKVINDFAQISGPDYFKKEISGLGGLDDLILMPYIGLEIMAGGDGLLSEDMELKLSIMNRIFDRIKELNDTIVKDIDKMFTTTNKSELLVIIKDIYRIALENARELATVNNWENSLEISNFSELKQSFKMQMGDGLVYNPSVVLNEAQSNASKDQYTIVVEDEFFLGGEHTFLYCDPVPPEYAALNSLGFSYAKREVFAQSYLRHLRSGILKYTGGNENTPYISETLAPVSGMRNFLYSWLYKRSFEGIYEQLFFALERSRIWSRDYVARVASRVEGQAQYDPVRQCLNNRYNLHHSGIMAFDKMLTENFMKEYQRELQRPENAPELLDYTQPGPMEKAIQNLIVRGFVKISLIELLLKGAIVYPVWDFESVIGDQFFQDFIFEYISNEFRTVGFFSENRESLLRTFERITGDTNANNSLKKIINSELALMPDLSKKIFENDYEYDYYDWFLSSLPTVSVSNNSLKYDEEIENTPALTEGLWFHPLSQKVDSDPYLDHLGRQNTIYNDPFFYIERYIRVSGPLATVAQLENRAAATFEVLQNLQPDLVELYDQLNLSLPLLDDYDYDFDEEEFTYLDDPWPEDELMSIEDFSKLVDEITPDEKYLYDLRALIYEDRAKGMPKAIKNLPYRPIKRSRKLYKMKNTPGIPASPDATARARLYGYGRGLRDGDLEQNSPGFMSDNQSFSVPTEYRDRFYVVPINGERCINIGFGMDIHGVTSSAADATYGQEYQEGLIRQLYQEQFMDRQPRVRKNRFEFEYRETYSSTGESRPVIDVGWDFWNNDIRMEHENHYHREQYLDVKWPYQVGDVFSGWYTKEALGTVLGSTYNEVPTPTKSILSPLLEYNAMADGNRAQWDKITKMLPNPPDVPLHPDQLRAEYFSNDYGLLEGESIYLEALEKNEFEAEHWVESVFDYVKYNCVEYNIMGVTTDTAMEEINSKPFDSSNRFGTIVESLFTEYVESKVAGDVFTLEGMGDLVLPDLGDKLSTDFMNIPFKFIVRGEEREVIGFKFVESFGSNIQQVSADDLAVFTDEADWSLAKANELLSSCPRGPIRYIAMGEHGGRINWQQQGVDRLSCDVQGITTCETIKIPTRVIVTQMKKESTGEILEVYSRTVYPNSISHMDSDEFLPERVELMERAFIELAEEYMALVDEIYNNFETVAKNIAERENLIEPVPPNLTLGEIVTALEHDGFTGPDSDELEIPEISNKIDLVRRIYPSFPSFVCFNRPAASNRWTAFYSTTKLYEKMCSIEEGLAAFEDTPGGFYSKFSNFEKSLDNLFSNPGLLMKNKEKDNLSLVTGQDKMTWFAKFWDQTEWMTGVFKGADIWGVNQLFNRNITLFESGDAKALKTYFVDMESESIDTYMSDHVPTGDDLAAEQSRNAELSRAGYYKEQALYGAKDRGYSSELNDATGTPGALAPRLGIRNEQYREAISALAGKRLGGGASPSLEYFSSELTEEDLETLRTRFWLKVSTGENNKSKMDTLTFCSALKEIQNNQTINYFYQYDLHNMASEINLRKFLHISLTNIVEYGKKRKDNSFWSVTTDVRESTFEKYYPFTLDRRGHKFITDEGEPTQFLGDIPIELPPFLCGGSPYVGDNRRNWEEFLKSMYTTRRDMIRDILAPEDGTDDSSRDWDLDPPTIRQLEKIESYLADHEMEILNELYRKLEAFYQWIAIHKQDHDLTTSIFEEGDDSNTRRHQIISDLVYSMNIDGIFKRQSSQNGGTPISEYEDVDLGSFAIQAFLLYWSELDYKRDTLAREIMIIRKAIEDYEAALAIIDGDSEEENWLVGTFAKLIKLLMFSEGPDQYMMYLGPWRSEQWDFRLVEQGDYKQSAAYQLMFQDSYNYEDNNFTQIFGFSNTQLEDDVLYNHEMVIRKSIYEDYLSPTRTEMDDYNFFTALNNSIATIQTEWYDALSMAGISALVDDIIASYYDPDGNIGSLFRDSKVSQGIRLVHSSPIDTKLENYEQANENSVVENFKVPECLVYSQEERTGLMPLAYIADSPENPRPTGAALDSYPYSIFDHRVIKYFNQPLANYEQEIELGECWQLQCFATTFSEFERFMKRKLSETQDFKIQVEYIFPVRRYMAMATVFSTSALSGYSTMPSVMNGTKRSFANIYALMENRNDFASGGAMDSMGARNVTNSELFNQMMSNMSQKGPNIECFAFPGTNLMDVLEQIGELLKWVVPLLIRGIADKLDPAFKEMKGHYLSCNLSEFSWVNPPDWMLNDQNKDLYDSSTRGSVINFHSEIDGNKAQDDVLWLGLNGDTPGPGETGDYIPVSIAFPADLTYTTLKTVVGTIQGLLGGGWSTAYSGIKGMGRTIDKFAAYVYSGNLPFLDLNMAFQIPCLDVDYENIADKYSVGTHGRYGHPFTVLTALAMTMPVLPGTVSAKKQSCPTEPTPAELPPAPCEEGE